MWAQQQWAMEWDAGRRREAQVGYGVGGDPCVWRRGNGIGIWALRENERSGIGRDSIRL